MVFPGTTPVEASFVVITCVHGQVGVSECRGIRLCFRDSHTDLEALHLFLCLQSLVDNTLPHCFFHNGVVVDSLQYIGFGSVILRSISNQLDQFDSPIEDSQSPCGDGQADFEIDGDSV